MTTRASKYITEGDCVGCGFSGTLDLHHIMSRKAGGSDDINNLMPLCRPCHQMIHKIGRNTFIKKRFLESWMKEHGWIYEDFFRKWIYSDFRKI